MAKLVDAPDLGSGAARRGGSSPSTRTTYYKKLQANQYVTGVRGCVSTLIPTFIVTVLAQLLSGCANTVLSQ